MDTESMDNGFLPSEECPSLKSSYNRDKSGGVKLRSIQFSQEAPLFFCGFPTSAPKAPASLEDRWVIST